ncbi:MAG: ATPase, T2SS/T4P/T4SS family [Myxococcota bacterium]
MFAVVITEKGGAQRRAEFDKNEVTIGRVQGNDIILPKGNVSKRHSRIVLKDDRFIVVDLKSTNGTYVNGRKITSPLVIKPGDKVYIGDFILTVEALPDDVVDESTQPPRRPTPPPQPAASSTLPPSDDPEEPAHRPEARSAAPPPPAPEGPTVRYPATGGPTDPGALRPDADRALAALMDRVGQVFDVHDADPHGLYDEDRRGTAKSAVEAAMRELDGEGVLDATIDRAWLAAAAVREAVGFGDLEPLLANESVREIVVEGPRRFLADLGGGLQPVDGRFSSGAVALTVARRLVGQAGDVLDPEVPIHEAALPHGPHVTVIQPPVAVRGPVLEVRRMAPGLTLDELVHLGTLSEAMRARLAEAVEAHRHIVVVGPAGSGVTTFVGALASLTPDAERILTVESIPDLSIDRSHVISLAAGAGNRIALRELVQRAALLRCDRLVMDDLHGAEVLDALTALSARQGGGLMGVHASADAAPLEALRALARLDRDVPEATLHALLAHAVHLVVQMARTADGRRRVHSLSEVVATPSGVGLEPLFVYDGAFKKAR